MFGARQRFKVCTGARYLGGYIGDGESKRDWLREGTLTWEKNIGTISKTTRIIPRRVMPQWYVQYNHNGHFYNASPETQETRSREWRK